MGWFISVRFFIFCLNTAGGLYIGEKITPGNVYRYWLGSYAAVLFGIYSLLLPPHKQLRLVEKIQTINPIPHFVAGFLLDILFLAALW